MDAADRGVGAVLSQSNDNSEDHPVAYFSWKVLPHEEKYSTISTCIPCIFTRKTIHSPNRPSFIGWTD